MTTTFASLPPLANALPLRPPSAPVTTTISGHRFREPSQDRPFLCPFPSCAGRFHRKFTLHEHLKTHTGEQPHQCPIASCGKRFSTSGNLARHKRLHALHKMECPVAGCTRIFTSQEMLLKHQKVHAGSAVHSCMLPGCGKTFSTAGNLTRHMKTQHGLSSSHRHHHASQHRRHRSYSDRDGMVRSEKKMFNSSSSKSSPINSTSSPSSSSNESPNEEFPFASYEAVSFTSLMNSHVPVSARTTTSVRDNHQQLQHILHSQSPVVAQTAQLPQQPHHQFPTNASLSDQDLQHLFECLF